MTDSLMVLQGVQMRNCFCISLGEGQNALNSDVIVDIRIIAMIRLGSC